MTRRRRRRIHPALTVAVPVIAILGTAAAARTMLHVIGWVAATAAIAGACWYAGRRSSPQLRPTSKPGPPVTARSLAQLNRQLNQRLDAMQAKLEAEMDRADRAEARWANRQ